MKQFSMRFSALLLSVFLLLSLAAGVSASSVPKPDDVYVYDPANVISPATEADLIARGNALFALTGAQIVTVAIRDGSATNLEKYSYDLFNSWGIGSAERNNGLLLVMNIETEDYWVSQGYGISDILSSGALQSMLDTYLEPDFAVGNYDAGALAFFNAALAFFESWYNADVSTWDGHTYLYPAAGGVSNGYHGGYESDAVDGAFSFFFILITLLVLFVIFAVLSRTLGFFRPRFGGYYSPFFFFGGPRGPRGPHGPPPGSFGGFGGGGFGGGSHGGGFGGGSFGGGSHGGGFGGGGSHGGGAGRH